MERPFPAYRGSDPYVFVSYSHADMDVVFPEIVWIHEAGVPLWYDEGIGAGASWRDEVANALADCTTFVYFVTPNAAKSDHCLQELNFALSKNRKVLTIHLERTELNIGLEMTLGDRQAIIRWDFNENRYREKVLEGFKLHRSNATETGGTTTEAGASARLPTRGPALLVAPFRHVGTHEFSQSLAESLPGAIANGLARFEEHTIIDPTAVSSRTSAESIRTTAQALGASWVLDGQVQTAGGKVRVIAHIAEVDTGVRTWSQTFDRLAEDVFEVEDELVAIIVSTTGEAVHEMTSDALAGKPQSAWNGFDYVLRGIELLHHIDPEENVAARRCFDTAIELEPAIPLALICRCWTYYFEIAMGWPTSRDDGLAYCIATIRKLFVKNDRSRHGHRLISRCMHNAGQHVEALKH
jgi:TolB-like protein